MGTVALTGKDTIVINDRVLNDFGDGDVANLSHPNELFAMKTGKNGNTIYAFNETGKQCDVTLRVLLGSSDDKFLQSLIDKFEQDPAAFTLLTGSFVKRVGDGAGNVNNVTYSMEGGAFAKRVDVKENPEGDTEQAIAIYSLKFSNAPRSIGG